MNLNIIYIVFLEASTHSGILFLNKFPLNHASFLVLICNYAFLFPFYKDFESLRFCPLQWASYIVLQLLVLVVSFEFSFLEVSIFKSYPGDVPGFMELEACTVGEGDLL